jgi:hypothetical protein
MKEVSFKAKYGKLWLRAQVVKKVKDGYILKCPGIGAGPTRSFFIENENVKPIKAA